MRGEGFHRPGDGRRPGQCQEATGVGALSKSSAGDAETRVARLSGSGLGQCTGNTGRNACQPRCCRPSEEFGTSRFSPMAGVAAGTVLPSTCGSSALPSAGLQLLEALHRRKRRCLYAWRAEILSAERS